MHDEHVEQRPRDRNTESEQAKHPGQAALTEEEAEEVEEHLPLRSPVIYEIVREEGEEELSRPAASLWWSAVTAGVALSMSLVMEGLLHHHLPDTGWRALLVDLGYPVGFLIVVFGRLQLFTENTITPVLPVMAEPTRRNLWLMLRLWGIVLAGNLLGTALFAMAAQWGHFFVAEHVAAMVAVAEQGLDRGALATALQGVPAGFLIAVMVWMLPSAEGSKFWIVLLVTYVVALGEFTHVVVGSSSSFLLLLDGTLGIGAFLLGFLLPALVGNVIGGTALFAALAHGQVRQEL